MYRSFNDIGQSGAAAELIKRGQSLLPLIEANAKINDEQRDVADATVDAIRCAGLFRLYQPRRWGGYEADPRVLLQIQRLFAESCPSTAWVFGVLSVQSFLIALFDERAQDEVWGEGGDAIASSGFAPAGRVSAADGGFRLSGRWSFSSGCRHAQWALLGGMTPAAGEGQKPSMRLFLVPQKDYEIIDTWHTFGLRGTGSNDIVVSEAFVPSHRTLAPDMGMRPLQDRAKPVLYRLPWLYVFTASVSNLGIGIARGALKAFVGIERERVSSLSGKAAKEDLRVQRLIGQTRAEIDRAERMFDDHISRFFDSLTEATMSMDEAMLFRTQLTAVLRGLAHQVDQMQLLLGGRGVYHSSPLLRFWLDMCAARAHPGNDPAAIEVAIGQAALSSDSSDRLI